MIADRQIQTHTDRQTDTLITILHVEQYANYLRCLIAELAETAS